MRGRGRRIKLILKNLGCKDVDWMSHATSCSHSDHNLYLLNVQGGSNMTGTVCV